MEPRILTFVYCGETGELLSNEDGPCPIHKDRECLWKHQIYEDGGPKEVFRLMLRLKEKALEAATWGGSFEFLEGEPEIYTEKDGDPV